MNPAKILSRITRSLEAVKYGDQVRPLRDWFIVLSIAAILLVASAVWSYGVYYTFTTEKDAAKGPDLRQALPASVGTIRGIFERRAVERAHYLNDYRFVDPSV
jgi:hypothetical protein